MALQDKYKELIDAAKSAGTGNLQVREQDGVLHIDGEAPTGAVKDQLWDIYGKIDPNYLTGDVVMNINVATAVAGAKLKVVTESSNLNVRKGPGTDQPIVGKAAHGEIVSLISKQSDQWWLIRTDGGAEGYAYAQYLQPVE
ncbi:SH3 domain-containing protein [Chitinophaga nivalis]|uniref:SH3 domain-containing protein n=1 Tax=Chitinophaga nivalis TaxID=2991709 RepID=A0ABT3IQT4_9BACT|nr:SH3 domain-containing protein [Chitinophaga nivalis]MCW3463990.1 SH3 domain-containing protein [Chitinophaga nivalis]MCW3486320.1 SH3 domain-containing protein [Chitinophaga nivalis]